MLHAEQKALRYNQIIVISELVITVHCIGWLHCVMLGNWKEWTLLDNGNTIDECTIMDN